MNEFLTLIQSSSFYEFAALLSLAAIGGLIGTFLRQPMIIVFIAVGLIVSPSGLAITHSNEEILLLAELGIATLLFLVGLKLDMKLIKGLGGVSIIVGLGQIFLTAILGMALCLFLGFSAQTSLIIAVSLSFSSTIIVVKLLTDKREINSMHGHIALGVLIIQDLFVVLSMIVLAAIGTGLENNAPHDFGSSLIQIAIYTISILVVLNLFMNYAALRLVTFIARSPELLLVFSIAWAILLAAICDALGLSKELGGLLAGISLASTPFREAIISRLSSLRDFLLLFFFIALGIQMDLTLVSELILPALVLSVFVLLFKPLAVMSLSGFMGYRKRTGFLAGISLAQISEFSLIFIGMSYSIGLVEQNIFGLVTLTGLITITLSTYLLSMSHQLYTVCEPFLGIFERKNTHKEQEFDTEKLRKNYNIIIFGLGRYGAAMAESFLKQGKNVLAVDFNPEEIKKWKKQGGDARYGDACDPDFFHTLPLNKAEWVVSALPQHNFGFMHEDPRLIILQSLKSHQYKGKFAVACHHIESVKKFKSLGVDLVFLPFHDAADRAVNMVLDQY